MVINMMGWLHEVFNLHNVTKLFSIYVCMLYYLEQGFIWYLLLLSLEGLKKQNCLTNSGAKLVFQPYIIHAQLAKSMTDVHFLPEQLKI